MTSFSAQAFYEGDDLGYLDAVTLNGGHFDEFDSRPLEFYQEDLINGEIVIRGLLESEQKAIAVEDLQVQITMDGGANWQSAKGNAQWVYHFAPELNKTYYFSIRVVRSGAVDDNADAQHQLFELGDFFLEIVEGAIDDSGVIQQGQGVVSGLPEIFQQKFSSLLDAQNKLPVTLDHVTVDIAQQRVTVGSVTVTPPSPMMFTLGPVTMELSALTFTPGAAGIDGMISLDGLGLPAVSQPFSALHLGQLGFNGEIDLMQQLGSLSVDIVPGDYGFGLALSTLRVVVNTENQPASMVRLSAFDGALRFGPGFGGLEVPDLTLMADNTIHWGKNLAAGVASAGHRLILPGNLFSVSDLGGSIQLAEKQLTLSGDLILPPELGAASITIPADHPLTLSAAHGLSSGGELNFPTTDLPEISLANIDSQLTALRLNIDQGAVRGALDGELIFEQFAGLRIAVSADIDSSGLAELTIDSGALNRTFDLDGFATLTLDNVTSGYYDHRFYVQIDGDLQATHSLFADYSRKVALDGLRIFKDGIAFVSNMDGWKSIKGGVIEINSAELALRQYGLGVENGLLWFGLKGQASYQNNSFDLTARIFQDKHYEISDFSFDGLTLSLGDFSLRTAAQVTDGMISGDGFINAGFLSDFIPAAMKDPLTGELQVSFTNLGVDLDAKTVTSGTVTVNFPRGMTVTLPAVEAELRSISFGSSGASVDGDIALTSVGGIELPQSLSDVNIANLALKPRGFKGTVSWAASASGTARLTTTKRGISLGTTGGEELEIPVLPGDYGLTLKLISVELTLDTSQPSPVKMVRLTDLDGSIELGSGYGMERTVNGLRLLADGAITWGVEQTSRAIRLGQDTLRLGHKTVADAKSAASAAADALNSGFSFTIPGTSFAVNNLTGRLYLADRQVNLWGAITLPEELGGGSFSLKQENSLVLSTSGLSTQGPVDIDLGSLSGFELAGFGAELTQLSLEISSNAVSGSVDGTILLSAFDNVPIAVDAAFDGSGVQDLRVATDNLERSFTLSNFAAVTLSDVEGGYRDGAFYIALDGTLALDNSQIGELPRTFDFADLKVFKDGLSLGDAALPMHDVASVNVMLNGDLQLSLNQYGFGVTDNRFWIALAGGVTYDDQSLTATAKLYHDGEFVLSQLTGDNLLIAIGDFTLRTSFDYSGGTITEAEGSLHLGALMASIPDALKNSLGELPVTIHNVNVDLSDPSAPKLSSGSIAFHTPFQMVTPFFTAQINGIEVGASGGTPYGKVLGGSIAFTQAGSLPMLEGVSLTNIGLTASGFSGTLSWSGDQDIPVFEDANYGITANLTAVSLAMDSSQTTFDAMVRLTTLDGSVVFGSGYGTALAPALEYAAGAYGFATDLASSITIPGTAIALKGFSGAIDFSAESVGFGGLISIPYEQTAVAFDVADLTFSASGVDGAINLANPIAIDGLGFPTVLTDAGLAFHGFALSSGHLGLDLTLTAFLDLEISAALALDNDGVSAWSLGGETDQTFKADAGFAELAVTDIGAGYDSTSGLFFSMNTDVKMKAEAVLSALPDDVNLSGLQVFSDHIDIDAAQMGGSFDNATVSLAGVDLTLNSLALGYAEADGGGQFTLTVGGGIALGDLVSADAEVMLYQDLSYTINQIEVDYTTPGFSLYGNLEIAEGRFMADLDVAIAGTLNMVATLEAGSAISADNNSFSYWRVALKSHARISLAPLPMNIYGIGGGIAYHETVSVGAGNTVEFTPDINTAIALTALVDLGTLDEGYTYFGKFSLTMEPTNYRIVLTGDSWFMKGKDDASGVPHLAASIELGASPAMLHVIARANLEKEMSGMTLLGVGGQVDLLFSESDWHIYFGSASQQLNVTLLEFLTGSGYVQLDSSGIAMGVRYEFDLEGSAWIFYGRVYGGAQIDLQAGIQPFYIDAQGKIWIGLEAGVKALDRKFEILSGYAELGGRFKAPPVYIGLHGTARYSFVGGLVSGTWEMTFTMPEDPPEGAADSGIEDMPLLAYSSPSNGATEISRLESVFLRTNMPLMTPFKYDDGHWYMLCVKDPDVADGIIDFTQVNESIHKAIRLKNGNSPVSVVGGRQGRMELNFTPYMALGASRSYTYTTTLELRHYDDHVIGDVVNSEQVTASFTTTDQPISFRERVYDVYPRRSTTPVYPETEIYLITKAVFDGYVWNWAIQEENLRFEVVNSAGEVIPGQVEGRLMVTDGQEGSRRYLLNFSPEQPLKAVRMVESSSGVKRPAIEVDGGYQNPFTYVPPTSQGDLVASGQLVSTGQSVIGHTTLSGTSATRSIITSGHMAATVTATQGAVVSGTGGVISTVAAPHVVGASSVLQNQALLVGESQETYRWYWDGEYQIQIVDGQGQKQYTSKFVLATPAQGSDELPFASTADVLELGISDAHFNIAFNVDQDAYRADVAQGERTIVYAGINDLWVDYENSIYGDVAETCQFHTPPQIEELVYTLGGYAPANWSDFDVMPEVFRAAVRRMAMEQCAPLNEQLGQLDQRFEEYKAAAFERHPSNEFRALEFRFRTTAPINWNEIDVIAGVHPAFSKQISVMGIDMNPGATTIHNFRRGEWFVRSQPDGLEHVLELKPLHENHFDGNLLLRMIGFHLLNHSYLQQFGSVGFKQRGLQDSETELDSYSGEYDLTSGTIIYNTGMINALTPAELLGR
ncbi:hypothetical protein [uncultured Desulfuromonas sp.]|uniref:hypothetical protein n=1 Tax=uncultured Desulfuromonas sp. TaxID=181013 RepID=UPI002AAB8957|nr:hypothetical protein [uncultured Desulfuromonas sp.]